MMPLVAILPEKIVSGDGDHHQVLNNNNMIDITERYARKLLSDRNVIERIKYLQNNQLIMIQQHPKVDDDDDDDDDD